ncbi:MAG: tetratricopeptide repeat protein, partial [Cyanobacteria bacterium J06600_6]
MIRLICASDTAGTEQTEALAWLNYVETQRRDSSYLERVENRLALLEPYDQARYWTLQKNFTAAKKALTGVHIQSSLERFLFAEIEEGLGDYESAYSIFFELYQENKERWDAGLKAGTTLLKARQGDRNALLEAARIFDELEKQKPFDTRLLTNKAFIALNQGNLRKAERLLVKALQQDPDNLKALENMVYLQILNNNTLQSKLFLDRLEAKHPDYVGLEALKKRIHS